MNGKRIKVIKSTNFDAYTNLFWALLFYDTQLDTSSVTLKNIELTFQLQMA